MTTSYYDTTSINNNISTEFNHTFLLQDRQQTLPLKKPEQAAEVTSNNHAPQKREATDNPPPPPPVRINYMTVFNNYNFIDGNRCTSHAPMLIAQKSVRALKVLNDPSTKMSFN